MVQSHCENHCKIERATFPSVANSTLSTQTLSYNNSEVEFVSWSNDPLLSYELNSRCQGVTPDVQKASYKTYNYFI